MELGTLILSQQLDGYLGSLAVLLMLISCQAHPSHSLSLLIYYHSSVAHVPIPRTLREAAAQGCIIVIGNLGEMEGKKKQNTWTKASRGIGRNLLQTSKMEQNTWAKLVIFYTNIVRPSLHQCCDLLHIFMHVTVCCSRAAHSRRLQNIRVHDPFFTYICKYHPSRNPHVQDIREPQVHCGICFRNVQSSRHTGNK